MEKHKTKLDNFDILDYVCLSQYNRDFSIILKLWTVVTIHNNFKKLEQLHIFMGLGENVKRVTKQDH